MRTNFIKFYYDNKVLAKRLILNTRELKVLVISQPQLTYLKFFYLTVKHIIIKNRTFSV